MKYCSKCGKELKDDDTFCPSCGAKVDGKEPVSASDYEKSGTSNKSNSSKIHVTYGSWKSNGLASLAFIAAGIVIACISKGEAYYLTLMIVDFCIAAILLAFAIVQFVKSKK